MTAEGRASGPSPRVGTPSLHSVAGVRERQFLGFVDVDEFVDYLVVGLVVDAERVQSLDGLFTQFHPYHVWYFLLVAIENDADAAGSEVIRTETRESNRRSGTGLGLVGEQAVAVDVDVLAVDERLLAEGGFLDVAGLLEDAL